MNYLEKSKQEIIFARLYKNKSDNHKQNVNNYIKLFESQKNKKKKTL